MSKVFLSIESAILYGSDDSLRFEWLSSEDMKVRRFDLTSSFTKKCSRMVWRVGKRPLK